jgi:hypothetical protein
MATTITKAMTRNLHMKSAVFHIFLLTDVGQSEGLSKLIVACGLSRYRELGIVGEVCLPKRESEAATNPQC